MSLTVPGAGQTARLTDYIAAYRNMIYKVVWFARWSVRRLARDQLPGRVQARRDKERRRLH